MSAADDSYAQPAPGGAPTPPETQAPPPQAPPAGVPYPPYADPRAAQQAQFSSGAPGYSGPPPSPPGFAGPGGYGPTPPPAKGRSRAWVWWLVGIVVLLAMCGGVSTMVMSLSNSGGDGLPGEDTIAVIPFDGTIAGTGSAPSVITPESFLKLLERAQDDPNVKAVVLRVNSPGGTVAASEEIATYVKSATKPVVVSVGDMDASGAYMVSSQADKIIAGPGSAVGSIGVIMEVPNASGLLEKIGLSFKVLSAGKYKDAGSPYRSLTPTETAMLQGQIDEVYGQFIDIVAEGRRLPRSDVASMATGWAWTGTEARRMHLVDGIGTYRDALKAAARLGGIRGRYRTDVYNDTESLSGLLSALLGIESQLQSIVANSANNPASSQAPALAR